jgi:hypothetical protein
MSLALLLAAVLGGILFTYLFDDAMGLGARLAAGVPVGLATVAWFGFLAASVLGLGLPALGVAGAAGLWPAAVAGRRRWARLRADLAAVPLALRGEGGASRALSTAVLLLAVVLLARIYARAFFVDAGGIVTGVDHNIGDLPFHIGIVMGFVSGGNIPPEHPELAGARLTYPFLIDFLSAMLMRAGLDLRASFLVPGLMLSVAFVVLISVWTHGLTRDRGTALLAPALVLLGGGLGFLLLARELSRPGAGLAELLWRLPRDYTIAGDSVLRWGNALTTLLVPQRSLLLGLPMSLLIWTWWWRAVGADAAPAQRGRLLLGAGIAAGLLPLAHAHSYALAVALAAALTLLFPSRAWARFFVPALGLGLPQMAWAAAGTAVQSERFVAWHLGWDRGNAGVAWFWLVNTGAFIPLLVAALLGRPRLPARVRRFWLPFGLCFVVPNVLRLSPWIWDNIKFLFPWYVASAPLVAFALVRLFRAGHAGAVAAAVLGLSLMLSGTLDVWRVASGAIRHLIFDRAALEAARVIEHGTPPRAVFAAWPTHDSPVLLAGRRSVLGYPGHIWSQGLEGGSREDDLARFFSGAPEAAGVPARYGADHVLVGPRERGRLPRSPSWPPLARVGEAGPYLVLRLTRAPAAEGAKIGAPEGPE